MPEAISTLVDHMVANPNREDLIARLEQCAHGAAEDDLALIRKYIEFETRSPTTFTLETVLACNLHCPECAIGGGLTTRKRKILSLDEFNIMYDKVKDWARYTYLHLWGEPFLNQSILEMTRVASQHSRVNLSTNALLIRKEQVAEIIASGVGDMLVSIDGATQDVYAKYRVGGNVDDAFRALGWLAEENRRQNCRVNIMPQFIVFGHNQHEMERFRARCNELGLSPVFKSPYLRGANSRFRASTLPQFQRKTWNDLPSLRQAISGCVNPPDVVTVDVYGKVILCCHDYDGVVSFGNLLESSFAEIWNHPKYRQVRWNILTGRPPRFCETKCMTYFPASEYPIQGMDPVAPVVAESATEIRVNLCGGSVRIPGWINVDINVSADIRIDLESSPLPWSDNSVDAIACISALNYFTPKRAFEILQECLRVLRPGGIIRVATQDLRILARKYIERDESFFLEKLADGNDRFPGETFADKLCNWFYGFESNGKPCRYVYDFESLSRVVRRAGFTGTEECAYRKGSLPDVELLDNRPEQMFFLEARKAGPGIDENKFEEGLSLWRKGRRNEAWQLLLERVRVGGLTRGQLSLFLPLVDECSIETEALKILKHLAESLPQGTLDEKIRVIEAKRDAKARTVVLDVERNDLFPSPADPPPTNEQCIKAGLDWIARSEERTGHQGSSANYDYQIGAWGPAYPETTGYMVPTLLRAAECFAEPAYMAIAKRMGDWLCSIQEREGGLGEAVGSFAKHPRVFNSGQALLGWIALHKAGLGDEYVESARRCGDWLCRIQDADGKWTRDTYAGPKPYHSRVGWALLELFAETLDEKYLDASNRHLQWTMSQAHPNGCFEGNSLSEPNKPWTHLIGYVLFGLVEQVRLRKLLGLAVDQRVLDLLVVAGENLVECHRIANENGVLAFNATYGMDWKSRDGWSCVTGNSQLAHFLTKLSHRTGNDRFEAVARHVMAQVTSIQFRSSSLPADMRGGLPGSFPHAGPYLRYGIPNWGVKFFVDALLEIDHPSSKSLLIG